LQNNSDSTVAVHERHGEAHAAHNPCVVHHFATEEQQRNSAGLGMWVLLATEVMFFGGLFCAYLGVPPVVFSRLRCCQQVLQYVARRH